MKLDILIVELLVVAAVLVPYLLLILSARREGILLENKFQEEAQRLGLHLVEKDRWNNNIIGLDKEKGQLLFLQTRRTGIVIELFDLKQVEACSILEVNKTRRINKRMEDVLEKLDLQLLMYNGSSIVVNLFDCEETYCQDYELIHAKKWNRSINVLLPNFRKVDFAA